MELCQENKVGHTPTHVLKTPTPSNLFKVCSECHAVCMQLWNPVGNALGVPFFFFSVAFFFFSVAQKMAAVSALHVS